jgi:hypothetical protein
MRGLFLVEDAPRIPGHTGGIRKIEMIGWVSGGAGIGGGRRELLAG